MNARVPESSEQLVASRLDRERDFHDHRFGHNPSRNLTLNGLTGSITLAALRAAYGAVKPLCEGAIVLDYGCAQGEASLILRKYGSEFVYGIDISPVAVSQATERAASASVDNVAFRVMNAEELVFSNNTFDVVFGIGILHHLDIDRACKTIARVLKPTGVAVFQPLGHNPIINLARYLTPGSRTPDEHPLKMSDLGAIRQHFQTVELRFVNLLTLLSTPVPAPRIRSYVEGWLASADHVIFKTLPWSRRFAWNVVVTMRHPIVTSKSG